MRRKKVKIKAQKPAQKKGNFLGFILFSACILALAYTLGNLDKKILPPVMATMEKTAKNKINQAIDTSLQRAVTQKGLNADDFYLKTTDTSGMINALSINTVLVNNMCSQMAVDISRELEQIGQTTVQIPISTILNLQSFANIGPTYPITVMPIGNATVDYDTSFEAVGINQIHFQLWLKVDSFVRVVNPIQEQEIIVSRKIALVNTVFSGKVPDTYMGGVPFAPLEKKN